MELAQVELNLSSPARHVEAWREARARTRAGESAGAVAQDVATRWNVSFSRSKAYVAKKPGSKTPRRPGGAPRIDAELEQALATMVEQLNTMDFTAFTEDVEGAADAMINGTAFEQLYAKGVTDKWYRRFRFLSCNCDYNCDCNCNCNKNCPLLNS